MATVVVQRESVERLECTVTADEDPTPFTVEFAFTGTDERPTTWTAGAWEATPGTLSGGRWTGVARTPIVGTGGLDLAEGMYQVWIRVNAGAEIPVKKSDRLKVA